MRLSGRRLSQGAPCASPSTESGGRPVPGSHLLAVSTSTTESARLWPTQQHVQDVHDRANATHACRFEEEAHVYYLDGVVVPSITQMLKKVGLIDDTYYTEESSERGRAVHALSAAYDLGALDVATCDSVYRPYLLAHVKVVELMRPRPTWLAVEEPAVHPHYRFGGRPDRVGVVFGLKAVWEVKSGAVERSHSIQTALQSILVAPRLGLPAHLVARFAEYLTANGKGRVLEHKNRHDCDKAYEIIRACT